MRPRLSLIQLSSEGCRHPATPMLARLAGEMPPAMRLVLANQRLFGPLIVPMLARSPSGDAWHTDR